jgi:hypothetical protein
MDNTWLRAGPLRETVGRPGSEPSSAFGELLVDKRQLGAE